MQEIRLGSAWKPVQSGIKLATSSILSLHRRLVVDGELKFLLSARFTQDALENTFSQVRAKGVLHPKPVQFRFSLRLICLAQFMAVPSSGSYDVDDTPHLISFVKSSIDDYPENDESFSMQDDYDQATLRVLSTAAALLIFVNPTVFIMLRVGQFVKNCRKLIAVLVQTASRLEHAGSAPSRVFGVDFREVLSAGVWYDKNYQLLMPSLQCKLHFAEISRSIFKRIPKSFAAQFVP